MNRKIIIIIMLLFIYAFINHANAIADVNKYHLTTSKYKCSILFPLKPIEYTNIIDGLMHKTYQSISEVGVFNLHIHENSNNHNQSKEDTSRYLQNLMKGANKLLPNAKIKNKVFLLVDGNNSLSYEVQFIKEGVLFKKKALSIYTNKYTYTISALYPLSNKDQGEKEYEAMLRSFRIH